MTYNFDRLKIPTFPGINNQPIEPTALKAGNGAHLISLFNQLITELESALNDLSSDSGNITEKPWKVLETSSVNNYQVEPSDRLILFNPDSSETRSMTLNFPDNPQPQTTFCFLTVNNFQIGFGNFYRYNGQDANVMNYNSTPDIIKFIYVDDEIGWISSRSDVLIAYYYN